MQKMMVFDMDGTLLNDQKELLKETRDILIEQEENGCILTLASGRVKPRMIAYAKELKMDVYGGYLIEANGSVIYDIKKDERFFLRCMSYEEADEIFSFLRKNYPNHEIMIMGDQDAYINLPKGIEESIFFNTNNMESLRNRTIYRFNSVYEIKEKFYKVCIYKDPQSIEEIMLSLKENDFDSKYWWGRTMPNWCEIMPKEVNKGKALKQLMETLHLTYEDVYVFGDGENDLSMLSLGHSIAMQNAFKHVQEACEFVTLSNNENGIAHFIKNYLKG